MIVNVPSPVLTTPARKVKKIDKKTLLVIQKLKTTLINTKNPKGVGLAAPQIGVPLRIFVMKPQESSPIDVFINPEIIWKSEDLSEIKRPNHNKQTSEKKGSSPKNKNLEGCLSIPNIWGYLKRPKKVKLRFMDINGQIHEKEYSSFLATIIQHETDHVNGILFTKRVLEQRQKFYRIEKDSKGNDRLVEVEI